MLEIMQGAKERGNLVYNFTAAIPYSTLNLASDSSNKELRDAVKEIILKIFDATGQSFVFINSSHNKDTKALTSVHYKCNQDEVTKRQNITLKKVTFIKNEPCKSTLRFQFQKGYHFITLTSIHQVHHKTAERCSMPDQLIEFIQKQNAKTFNEVYIAAKISNKFSNYMQKAFAGGLRDMKRLWEKCVAEEWKKDPLPLLSCKKLLDGNLLSNVKPLKIDIDALKIVKDKFVAIYFDYGTLDKKIFTSAAIDGTYYLTSSLRQCHAIVGEYKGEGYPLALLFVPKNDVPGPVIRGFLEATVNLGYKFQYVTTDMDMRNINAISTIPSLGIQCVQLCLWHVKKAIRERLINKYTPGTARNKYQFLFEYEWFDKELFDRLDSTVAAEETIDEAIAKRTAKFITRGARDSPLFYSRRTSVQESKNITIRQTKTFENICEDLLKDVYDFVLVKEGKIRYFQYLVKGYLNPAKLVLWCRGRKSYVPRMTNMMVESYFKSVKHYQLNRLGSLILDQVLFILNKEMDAKYFTSLKRRMALYTVGRDINKNKQLWKNTMNAEINYLLDKYNSTKENDLDEPIIDLLLWTCSCGGQKFSQFYLCKHLVGCYVNLLGVNRKHFLSLYSERRITVPLVINRVINYGNIESINGEEFSGDLLVKNLELYDRSFQRRDIEGLQVVNESREVGDNLEEDELFSDSEDEFYGDDMLEENNGVILGETVSINEQSDDLRDELFVSESEVTGNDNIQLFNGVNERCDVLKRHLSGLKDASRIPKTKDRSRKTMRRWNPSRGLKR